MGLFDGLIEPNATVTIQRRTTARDASGGNAETWTTVVSGVDVLVSGLSGSRDQRFDAKNNTIKGTCTGEHSALTRQNIRLLFTSGILSGLYAHADSLDPHSRADHLLDDAWFSVRFSTYQEGGAVVDG